MNNHDSSTIYISHSDDISHESSMLVPSTNIDSTPLSKKVAQNRAAQRAFRERKQHYVDDLEKKAKQLDECKRAMIQLQADNECLRKSVARLEGQLKQCLSTNSSTQSMTKSIQPAPVHQPLLPSLIAPPPTFPLTNLMAAPTCFSLSPPPSSSSLSSSSSSPVPVPLSPLSKREKKRQRLLADEKLHKNDDLAPIQLHCPLAPSYSYQQQQQDHHHPSKEALVLSNPFIPSSSGPPIDPNNNNNSIRFLQLLPTTMEDNNQDHYIHFVEDNNNPPSQ